MTDQPMSREQLEKTVELFHNTGAVSLIKEILENDAALREELWNVNDEGRRYIVKNMDLRAENERLKAESDTSTLAYESIALQDLRAQVTALERDLGIQREYWSECEHKLAAMTKERDELFNKLHVYQTVYGGDL